MMYHTGIIQAPCRSHTWLKRLATIVYLALASCGDDAVVPDPPPSPAALAIHSGDGQTARTGTAAAEPVRVRVTAQSGAGLGGVTVSFEVTAGGGSVPSATSVTDVDGVASPGNWTLGAPGPQELRASVAGVEPVVFRATAMGIPARIAVVAGTRQRARVGTPIAVAPAVRVTDSGGQPLADVVVSFATEGDATVANFEVTTDARGRADPGAWTLGTVAGAYRLTASLDEENVQGNPLHFEAVALPGPVAQVVAIEGDLQESETTLPVPLPPRVRVEDEYGNRVAGVTVSFAASRGSQVIPNERATDPEGMAAVDKWILGTTAGATYRLTASVANEEGATVSATFTGTATPAVFDIEIVHVSSSLLTDSQREVFEKAEQFWESAITGNLGWSTLLKSELQHCLDQHDITEDVPGDRVVDDLLIYVEIKEIDGSAGVFGGAGPCQIRAVNSLPVVGIMFFDLGDMVSLETKGHLEGTILHEMAHVLGFGTLWSRLGLLRNRATASYSGNTRFLGEAAAAAFVHVGGSSYTDGSFVPVQNVGGEGVWNGHWPELVFRTELMTPFIDRGLNPLSVVSIASLVDIGYEGVDYGVADDFVLPPPAYAAENQRPSDAAGSVGPSDAVINLGDDILRTSVAVVDRDGNVIRRIPPPQP